MAKRNYGLAKVEFGDIESDGGVATSFTEVGDTVSDSMALTSTDPQTTDFNTEQSDSPIETIVSTPAQISLAFSTYDVSAEVLEKLFGGSETTGLVKTFGTITPGSSYTNGTYTNVALTGGAGTGAKATIVVAGTVVTSVTLTEAGSGYVAGNSLSAAAVNIGGTGSGFAVVVSAITSKWELGDTLPEIEQSVRLTDKKGNVITIPRGKVIAKLNLGLSKTKLGQLDVTVNVLQPLKSGTKRMTVAYA
ncbi:hypothetical protein [Flaviaesturariibacter amylovorans]|uniref:Major tail protein n=1 Tax=Flaviaesturariibacter amylovorans TaxID=1084520 RepID=A0ABP8GQU2_9BACT